MNEDELFKTIDLMLQNSQYTKETPLALSNKIRAFLDEVCKEFYDLIQGFPDLHEYFEEEAKEVADNWCDKTLKPLVLKWLGEEKKEIMVYRNSRMISISPSELRGGDILFRGSEEKK